MTKPSFPAVGRREREILEAVYAAGTASVADVRARLADPPSYSAVRTMLTRLVVKRHLRAVREGMRYIYSPTASREKMRTRALGRVVNTFFGGSLLQAVSAMLDDRDRAVSPEEVRELQRLLVAARKEGR